MIIGLTTVGQNDLRINSIENNLEILAVENPQFAEKVNVNVANTTLSNFLLAVSKVHNINLNVAPELNSIEIINNFSNVTVGDLLIFLAKEYQLNIDITGNIISVSKFQAPVEVPIEKEIIANYDATGNLLSLDLKNDPLENVFRKITDISGKNLVYPPGMENTPLSIYFTNVPFEIAMEKLAMANNLKATVSRDGFYIFESAIQSETEGSNQKFIKPDSFYYKVIDEFNKTLEVDFKDASIEDVITALSEDLKINVLTASPLANAGTVTIKSDRITFDDLLERIFESALTGKNNISSTENQNYQQNNPGQINLPLQNQYTFKKENGLYYFGTENQLALKDVEVIPMMHRSILMLSSPSNNSGSTRSAGRSGFMTGTTNYYGGNQGPSQGLNSPNISNQDNRFQDVSSQGIETATEAIQKIIPDELQLGLEIKIDPELNSFIVSGPAANIERFKRFVQYIDKPVPVILIEVMILEVSKTALVETGVSFGLGEGPVETKGQAFPAPNMQLGAETINQIIGGFSGFGSYNLGKVVPNFYMNLKAMETNGNLKILSTPKLSTLNGHKAHLSSGETTYYAVTSQSFFGSQIPQATEIKNYYPIDAELALEILPFVSGDGQITMDILVVQSSFNGERIEEDAPPGMNSREFSSIIRMRDQDIAILGGIEQRTKDDSGTGVPLLARIPLIKWLFSERRREDSKKKLTILIKPTVIY